jgi:excisionase family DNA binding protein
MEPQTSEDVLLTPRAVASLLFVDRKTVSRWAQVGKLPFIRTPGGHHRYWKSDVLAVRDAAHVRLDSARRIHHSIPEPRGRDPMSPEEQEAAAAAVVAEAVATALEADAAEAARTVLETAAAVSIAAGKAAEAARRASEARAFAADETARSVAREAVRTAARVQVRADVAARQVAIAAQLAVDQNLDSTDDAALARAAILAASVAVTAAGTAQDTMRAAGVVAAAVAAAAAHTTRTIAAAEEAYGLEVSRAATELLTLNTETARRVAVETEARAEGVALAAREAAAALYAVPPAVVVDTHDEDAGDYSTTELRSV